MQNFIVESSIIPSRVSGRGYKIGPVCVCVCVSVCLSVCQHSHGWTVWATDLKFGRNIAFDNISDKFEGQGQRSRTPLWKKRDFPTFSYVVTYVDCKEPLIFVMTSDVMWRHGKTSWRHVMSRPSWHPSTTSGQEYWQRGHVAGGRVNTQAFSLMYEFGWYNLEMDAWVNHVESCLYLPEDWICLNQAWALLGFLIHHKESANIHNNKLTSSLLGISHGDVDNVTWILLSFFFPFFLHS